jgi:hypothetical protein
VTAFCRALLPAGAAHVLHCPSTAQRRPNTALAWAESDDDAPSEHNSSARGAGLACLQAPPIELLDAIEATSAAAGSRSAGSRIAGSGGGGGGAHCSRPRQLLLLTLDALCCAPLAGGSGAAEPALGAGLTGAAGAQGQQGAWEQLLYSTAPGLLGGAGSGQDDDGVAAALVATRCVRRLLVAPLPLPDALLLRGWRRCCGGLTACLAASGGAGPGTRLQACRAMEAAAERLGAAALEWEDAQVPPAVQGVAAQAAEAETPPRPARELLAALDDAQDAVRCAAARALCALLGGLDAQHASGGSCGGAPAAGPAEAAARAAAAVRRGMAARLDGGAAAGCEALAALLRRGARGRGGGGGGCLP